MKRIWILASIGIVLLIIVFGSIILWQNKQLSQNHNILNPTVSPIISHSAITSPPFQPPAEKMNIIVTSPKAMEMVTLPITIKGEAKVFENQFNYRVRDVNNNIILEGNAYANSPDAGQSGAYTIQVTSLPTMRANAITLEVFDYSAKDGKELDTVSIPVVFDPANTISVNAFFSSKQVPTGQECTHVYSVEHHVISTQQVARAALGELLKGPMAIEKNNGYYTNISDGVKIQKLIIENGVAKVDFDKRLEEGSGGSCKTAAIRAQITQTLKQFPNIKDVVISIDGRAEDILQP